jgi:hypothetical protein
MVLKFFKRDDFIAPDPKYTVRDKDNKIIGVKRFVRRI